MGPQPRATLTAAGFAVNGRPGSRCTFPNLAGIRRGCPIHGGRLAQYSRRSRHVSIMAMKFSGFTEEWMLLELDRQ